jgi:hypothetical protein
LSQTHGFVCRSCRKERLGTREQVLGSVGRFQEIAFIASTVLARGYLAGVVGGSYLGVRSATGLVFLGFLGAFLPWELLPRLAGAILQTGFGVLLAMGVPLGVMVLVLMYPHNIFRIFAGDVEFIFGLVGLRWHLFFQGFLVRHALLGALGALALGIAAGGADGKMLHVLKDRVSDSILQLMQSIKAKSTLADNPPP